MSKFAIYLFVLSTLFESCNRYPESDFYINQKTRDYLAFYKPNDIWIFKNSKSEIDTFLITPIDSSTHRPPLINFLGYGPRRTITINFRLLSQDSWYEKDDSIKYAGCLQIIKEPHQEPVFIRVAFTHWFGISGNQDSLGIVKSDSLLIDKALITKYIDMYSDIDNIRLHKAKDDSLDIMHIYWVNKYGIIAYKYRNGDFWQRINLK